MSSGTRKNGSWFLAKNKKEIVQFLKSHTTSFLFTLCEEEKESASEVFLLLPLVVLGVEPPQVGGGGVSKVWFVFCSVRQNKTYQQEM